MKAEKVLRNHIPSPKNEGEKNDDINIIKAMQDYARIQIEKDRKAVIENAPLHKRLDIIYAQHNTPINLD